MVHVDHGIGRFGGLTERSIWARVAESSCCSSMLKKPNSTSRSNGSTWSKGIQVRKGHQPTLDRLGGLGWQKTKAKAKRAMRDMADELCDSTPKENWWADMPLRQIHHGSGNLKMALNMCLRRIRRQRLKTSSEIWRSPHPWTASCAATLATARLKLRCAQRSSQ